MRGRNWESIAKKQKSDVFGKGNDQLSTKQMESMMQLVEYMCSLEDDKNKPAERPTPKTEKIWIEARKQIKATKVGG